HRRVPVSRDLVDAVVGGGSGAGIRRVRVDRVVAGQNHRPVVIVVLPGKEEGAREAVVLGPMMSVVLVRGDGVLPEASVTSDVVGKLVVVTEEDRFAIAREDELGRKRPVERP